MFGRVLNTPLYFWNIPIFENIFLHSSVISKYEFLFQINCEVVIKFKNFFSLMSAISPKKIDHKGIWKIFYVYLTIL